MKLGMGDGMGAESRLPTALFWLTWAAMAAVIASPLMLAGLGRLDSLELERQFPGLAIAPDLPGVIVALALAIGLLPMAAALYALWQTQALFALYRAGHALTAAAAERIGRIGAGLVMIAVAAFLAHPAQVLVLTLTNPPGARVLAVAVSSGQVGLLLAGGLLVAIGRVMRDAALIADDNAQIV